MRKQIFCSSFAIISMLLVNATNNSSAFAAHPSTARTMEKTINIKSQTGSSISSPENLESIDNITNSNFVPRKIASDNLQSMQYVKLALDSQKRGEITQSIYYYYEALKIDKTNAYAFLGVGTLLGNTEEGIICVQAAVLLFKDQNDHEGYYVARSLLDSYGIYN
jgi:tetratricopeptide (TPR) repeat protein